MAYNVKLDRSFVKMEKRGLTFLLRGQSLELYRQFLNRSAKYQDLIRKAEENDWWRNGEFTQDLPKL